MNRQTSAPGASSSSTIVQTRNSEFNSLNQQQQHHNRMSMPPVSQTNMNNNNNNNTMMPASTALAMAASAGAITLTVEQIGKLMSELDIVECNVQVFNDVISELLQTQAQNKQLNDFNVEIDLLRVS